MIKLADSQTKESVRLMWQICFDDTPEFVNLYFSEKYKDENTLVYFIDDKAVASLQMIPYRFTFCGTEIPSAYISGACTLPEYRNRGIMGQLLLAAFEVINQRNIPLSILIPAEEWLYSYYAKYGYHTVFQSDDAPIPLEQIIRSAEGNMDIAYAHFDALYRKKDFCVQKTKSDFITIVEDFRLDEFPVKTNLSGMARIIDAQTLLTLFAQKYPDKSFAFELKDKELTKNNSGFKISNGKCQSFKNQDKSLHQITVNELCQLLFGFQMQDFSESFFKNFPSHSPVMNLMLE